MNEKDVAERIIKQLDLGTADIKQGTLYRLQSARQAALAKHAAPKPVFGLVFAGGPTGRSSFGFASNVRFWLSAAALMAVLVTANYWQGIQNSNNDIEEVDTALLTSDLPINAYLDSGFDAWLKRSSH